MASGKQKKETLKQRRREELRRADPMARGPGLPKPPPGAVMADLSQLMHDNIHGRRPLFYLDKNFCCRDCGVSEVWTASDQKWWYEVAKGKLASRATHCSICRKQRQSQKSVARKAHINGLIEKYGIVEAAKRLQQTVDELQACLSP